MAYGDYNGPDKLNKGHERGACNRQSCQAEPALWWNHGSHSWYCTSCRDQIEFDDFNYRDWQTNYRPKYGHPMFETREMMNDRLIAGAKKGDHSDVGMYVVRETGYGWSVIQWSTRLVITETAGEETARKCAAALNACAIVPLLNNLKTWSGQ